MEKALFTAHIKTLQAIQTSLRNKHPNNYPSVLDISYFLSQHSTDIQLQKYKIKVSLVYTNTIDPMEGLKKRKSLKILKVLNMTIFLKKHKKTLGNDYKENIETYEKWIIESLSTIGLDRIEQDGLRKNLDLLLNYNL